MFRATLLSIVLLFAAGPSASLLCKAWCEPKEAAARGCHQQDDLSSTSVAGRHSCQDGLQGSSAVVKEDLRRLASAEWAGNVVAVAHLQLALEASRERPSDAYRRPPSSLKRPLSMPLRI